MITQAGGAGAALALFTAVLIPAALCEQVSVDPNLAGQWVAPVPGTSWTVTLRIETSGRCSVDEDSGFCQVRGGVLTFRESDGETVRYSCRLQDGQLILSGGDMTEAMVFRRAGPPGGGASGAAPAPPPAGGPAAAQQRPQSPGYRHADWGLGFDVPPAWKVAKREDVLLLASDSEPGMIVIRLVRGTSESALLEDYREGLTEEGLRLTPSSPSQPFSPGGYKGLAGELAGVAADNSRIQARVVAVMSPFGDAAVFLGITTAEKYAQLKPRVDAAAASVSFTKPRAPEPNLAVAGQYYYFHSSAVGGYSRDDTLNLCANGMFNRGGELSASQAGQWGVASQGGSAGRWSATGNGAEGVITLSYSNGQSSQIRYQRAGADMILDGRKYARFGDGSCSKRSPF